MPLSKAHADLILRRIGSATVMGDQRDEYIAAMAARLMWAGVSRPQRRKRLHVLNALRCLPPLRPDRIDMLELYHAPLAGGEATSCH